MHDTPDALAYSAVGDFELSGAGTIAVTAMSIESKSTPSAAVLYITTAGGLTAGYGVTMRTSNTATATLGLGNEL